MMRRSLMRLCALMLIVLMGVSSSMPARAFSSATHDKHLKTALFGENGLFSPTEQTVEWLDALTHASYLCIDQFQGNGQDSHLTPLLRIQKFYWWRFLPTHAHYPKEISEINYTAFTHRVYTHLGWNDAYYKQSGRVPSDWIEGAWQKRKNILRATVEAIFDFKKLPWSIQSEKGESFCQLVYCIHILGDHINFEADTYKEGYRDILPLAGRHGETQPYLIYELIRAATILFKEKDISALERDLNRINNQLIPLLNHPEQLATEDGFQAYHACAEEILKVLSEHLPMLLREEDFFRKAFYPNE